MTTKVETFEHDIADEIRRKEATLAEIQAVTNQISPTDLLPQKKASILVIILVTLLILALGGIGGLTYYYFTDPLLSPSAKPLEIKQSDIPKLTAEVSKLSPTLGTEIGRYISLVEKKDKGYVLTINNYSVVFVYMTRNESVYIDDLLALFAGISKTSTSTHITLSQTTSTPTFVASTATPVTNTTLGVLPSASSSIKRLSTATSTKLVLKKNPLKNSRLTVVIATTTEKTILEKELVSTPLDTAPVSNFSDITITNQNMRVYKKDNHTVVYAFVGDKTILISETPEGILSLKNAILLK